MSFAVLDKELESGKIRPLYFLHGEESFLMEETRRRIESFCLQPGMRDFNYDLFVGGETTPERIIDAARTLPMMSPWRVIVVKDAQLFTSQQVKTLISYCEKPSSSTCLILLGTSLGPWRGHLNVFREKGKAIAFSHPKGSVLTRHIVSMARQLEKKISPEAADLIREMVGNHLAEVYQELSKLAAYVGDRREIRVDDVETVISPIRTHSIFDLTRAMGMRKRSDALSILNHMLESGEPPLRILTMIVRQFRLLWIAKEMRSLGVPDRDIGKTLGIPEFVLQGFLTQTKNFTAEELEEGYRHLFQTDLVLKSRSTPRGIVLENLIISLCH